MKAAIRRTYGPPSTVQVEAVPQPILKDGEVLIKVHATTVNRTDCAVMTGKPYIMRLFIGWGKPRSPVLGTDFAGVIEAAGKGVEDFKKGDRVWGFYDEGLGSQAEYMTYSAQKNIARMPEGLSFEQAAASLEATHYAYNFLNKVKPQAGQKVLINGATGAIGSALLQFIKHENSYVTAVCNTPQVSLIQSLGADKVYDYSREDFTQDEERYDFVFDAVGKSSFGACKHLLTPRGIYISSELGKGAQNPFLALITPLLGGKKVIFPLPINIKRSLAFIADRIAEGTFNALIDRTYPLEEIADAYEYVASGQKIGNVVIRISS